MTDKETKRKFLARANYDAMIDLDGIDDLLANDFAGDVAFDWEIELSLDRNGLITGVTC